MNKDPYIYPGTDTLVNRLEIEDATLLQEIEIKLVDLRIKEGLPKGLFDYDHLKKLHGHLFQDLYSWAGQERTIRMSKGGSQFAFPEYIRKEADKLFTQLKEDDHLKGSYKEMFCKKAAFYFSEINALHPFREGNGRTCRLFFDGLAEQAGYKLAWHKTNHREFIQASIDSFNGNNTGIEKIFLTVATSLEKRNTLEKTAVISKDPSKEM